MSKNNERAFRHWGLLMMFNTINEVHENLRLSKAHSLHTLQWSMNLHLLFWFLVCSYLESRQFGLLATFWLLGLECSWYSWLCTFTLFLNFTRPKASGSANSLLLINSKISVNYEAHLPCTVLSQKVLHSEQYMEAPSTSCQHKQ